MFTYHIINKDACTMVLPEGEMAYGVCDQLERIVSAHMGPGGVLSFNMKKVSFLDCAGVGFLVQMKNCRKCGTAHLKYVTCRKT